LTSLALMRLGDDLEWSASREMVLHYLNQIALPAVLYDAFLPGVATETS
jgi:hypothetical protein